MKVLVTGGNGFIGRYVIENLLMHGFEVLNFDRHGKHVFDHPRVENYLGDITDPVAMTEAMAHSEAFIHLAGVLGTQETINNPRPAALTNIVGGLNLLEAAAQYDVPGVNIAVGNYWMNNTYSITKNSVERFIDMFNTERGTEITIVRALNAYGPRQVPSMPYGPSKVRKIMPAFIMRALHGHAIEVYGDGSQVMDMIYVDDVARVLVSALQWTIVNGHVTTALEAGSGKDTTVNDIARAVITAVDEEYGVLANVKYLPMRPGEPESSVVLGDPQTLRAINFDIPSLVNLHDGIRTALPYYKDWLDKNK